MSGSERRQTNEPLFDSSVITESDPAASLISRMHEINVGCAMENWLSSTAARPPKSSRVLPLMLVLIARVFFFLSFFLLTLRFTVWVV